MLHACRRRHRHVLALRLPRGHSAKGAHDACLQSIFDSSRVLPGPAVGQFRLQSTDARGTARHGSTAAASTKRQRTRNPNLDHIPGVNPDPTIVHAEVVSWEDNIRDDAAYKGLREDSWWTGLKPAECAGLRERKISDNHSIAELVSLPAIDLRAPSRDAMQVRCGQLR